MKQVKDNCSFNPRGVMVFSLKIQNVSLYNRILSMLPPLMFGTIRSLDMNLKFLRSLLWHIQIWRATAVSRRWRISPMCSPILLCSWRVVLHTYSRPHWQTAIYAILMIYSSGNYGSGISIQSDSCPVCMNGNASTTFIIAIIVLWKPISCVGKRR